MSYMSVCTPKYPYSVPCRGFKNSEDILKPIA